MHETALLSRVIELVEQRLADRPGCRLVAVRLRVTPWSHLWEHDAGTLNATFAMVAAGTRAEGAVLEITRARTRVTCPTCGRRRVVAEAMAACDACGAATVALTEEPDVWLQDIEVEET